MLLRKLGEDVWWVSLRIWRGDICLGVRSRGRKARRLSCSHVQEKWGWAQEGCLRCKKYSRMRDRR